MALKKLTENQQGNLNQGRLGASAPMPGQLTDNPREKVQTPALSAAQNVPQTQGDLPKIPDATPGGVTPNPRDTTTVGGNLPEIPLSMGDTPVPKVDQGQTIGGNLPDIPLSTSGQTPPKVDTGMPSDAPQLSAQEQLYQGVQQNVADFADIGMQGIEQERAVKENARTLQLQQALGSTNAVDMLKAIGKDLNDLSQAELEQLAVSQGLDLREEDKQRIKQEGAQAIESLGYERGDRIAEVDYQKDQLERTMGRALKDQEKFNAQQDAKLRRLAGAFGFGGDLGANISTMQIAQEGQQALNDLSADFAGRGGLLANQADAVQREYYSTVREVESQTNAMIQSKYAEIQNTISDLIQQGVTDEEDLRKATFELQKEYVGLYNDANKMYAEYLTDAQKTAFDQMAKATDMQREQDKLMSDQMGIVIQDGQPLLDETGQPISTADMLKFMTTEQRQMYALEQDQAQFEARLGFDIGKEEFSQMMEGARFTQSVEEFNANYGLNLSKFEYDQLKDSADREISLADKGLSYVGGGVDITQATSSFKPQNSKYSVTPDGNGVSINTPTKTHTVTLSNGQKVTRETLTGNRKQCGMYVNDVIGIPGYFGNTLASKTARVTSQTPTPGSAFVMDIAPPYGHVGIVEKVNPDGTMTISESNYDDKESFRRVENVTMAQLKARNLVGFTGGLQQNAVLKKEKAPALDQGEKIETEMKLADDFRAQTKEYRTQVDAYDKLRSSITSIDEERKTAEATPQGDLAIVYGFMKALDPSSVVREGEFATASNTGGLSTSIRNNVNKVISGGSLTPEQRYQFLKQAEQQANPAKVSMEKIKKDYEKRASNYDIDFENIVGITGSTPAVQSNVLGGALQSLLGNLLNR